MRLLGLERVDLSRSHEQSSHPSVDREVFAGVDNESQLSTSHTLILHTGNMLPSMNLS